MEKSYVRRGTTLGFFTRRLAQALSLLVWVFYCDARADEVLSLPRFVSLASPRVYVRVGPDKTYRVAWEFNREGLPVEIFLEYDTWRKIRDQEGTEGWVHKSMLSRHRTVVFLKGQHPVYAEPKETAKVVAYVEENVIAKLGTYSPEWCQVSMDKVKGWVRRTAVWGLYPQEQSSPSKCWIPIPFLCRKAATK